MSWATTRALIKSTIEGAASTATVHNRIRTDIDRDDAVTALAGTDGKIRCVEFTCVPGEVLGGAYGYQRTSMRVRVVVTWHHDDANDSYGTMADGVRLIMEALASPLVFPQLSPEGILTLDAGDTPLKLRTGPSAYRLVFGFELIDVEAS